MLQAMASASSLLVTVTTKNREGYSYKQIAVQRLYNLRLLQEMQTNASMEQYEVQHSTKTKSNAMK